MYADRITRIAPSQTIAITTLAQELKAQGKDVLSFSAGEPDFDTPPCVKEAAKAAIDAGFSKYTAVKGIPELLQAIAKKLQRDNGLDYSAEDVMVGNGAKQSLFNAFQALINPGDEVIIPAPYWVSYPELVTYSGGKNVFLPTSVATEFKITAEQLQKALTPKTKMLVLTTPSNPTGMIYTKAELQALADVLKGTKVWVLSDEIYEKLVYEGSMYSFGALEGQLERTITVNGLSKSLSMTGWRVGYLATKDKTLLKHMLALQSHSTSNINSVAQKASLAALQGCAVKDIENMRLAFKERRDAAYVGLNEIKGLSTLKPQGAFYLWIKIPEQNSLEFCQKLLAEQSVALVPGIAFGVEGFVRMSYACSLEQIKAGLERLKKFMA
ncbi:aminotransferase [Helicobacter heilmannii]|uniref:Aminotransferase n=1 Tax=Helicobacter heilmannii TaxID=35817 RepID=A0A0K2YBR7_HELHE|nr:pyridoxal phosphate-dependent aminotransferase [Helicobacter heilmannii]BDQ26994.1 aminotransferase [Helicobacter heilmannii]CRI34420.1 Aspartate aminotransferase [Helicobacter heilmannii]